MDGIGGLLHRIDHVLLNDGVSRVGVHEAAEGQKTKGGDDDDHGHLEGNQIDDGKGGDGNQEQDAQKRHDIPFDTHDGEDQGVLKDLAQLHVEGHQHEVGVEPHDTVDQDEGEDHDIHDAVA